MKARIKNYEDLPPEIICNCPNVVAKLQQLCGTVIEISNKAYMHRTYCKYCNKSYTGPHFCILPSHSQIPALALDIDEGGIN